MPEYLSRSAFQRATGRTRAEVEKLLAAGMPHEVEGTGRGSTVKIDLDEAMAWLAARPPRRSSDRDLHDARARLAKVQADAMELKNAKLRSELLDAEEAAEGWRRARAHAEALLMAHLDSWMDELMALLRQGDPRAVREFLDDKMHAALTELARTDFLDADGPAA